MRLQGNHLTQTNINSLSHPKTKRAECMSFLRESSLVSSRPIFYVFFFIFYWLFYLFAFQMLSPFPVFPPQIPYWVLPHPRMPTAAPWHSPTLGHPASTGPRASSPIDAGQGHPLLHMQLEPLAPPCVLFG